MKIKSNKIKFLYIFCICFIFILINSTIVLTISNSHQVAFSQGYIPPPPQPSPNNTFQSQSIQQCPQISFSGPTYIGPDGCTRPCPTSGGIPNGCPINTSSRTTTLPSDQNQQNNILGSSLAQQPTNKDQLESNSFSKETEIKKHFFDIIANGYLTINVHAINVSNYAADRISVCVDTQSESGEKTMADPHCSIGANKSFKFIVQPGQVVLSTKSYETGVDKSPCLFNISPRESKMCNLYFYSLFSSSPESKFSDLVKLPPPKFSK
jgi:hypothetical protein